MEGQALYDEETPNPRTQAQFIQVIGASEVTAEKGLISLGKKSAADGVAGGGWCRVATVLLLASWAAGACIVAALHVHHDTEEQDLNNQVNRLKAEKQALEVEAGLARQEQQELAQLILDPTRRKRLENMMQRSKAFDAHISQHGFKSGPDNTVSVRKCLGKLLFELNISSMLDTPCGPASWQHLIPGIENVTYVGGDISLKALEKALHRPETQSKHMNFMLFDPVHFPLKKQFDLVLMRDLVESQKVQDTLTAVLNLKASGSKYLAATYWPGSEAEVNEAAYRLAHAGWYEANLLEKPFSFPAPLASCDNVDIGSSSPERRAQSRLGIWRLKDLPVTAAAVEAADPARFRPRERARLPQQVHVDLPRQQQRPSSGLSRPGPREVTLDELLNNFGQIFAPERQRRPHPVFQQRQARPPVAIPFDGLFNDWLETPGPAFHREPLQQQQQQQQPQRMRRPSMMTQFFDHPEFQPKSVHDFDPFEELHAAMRR